MLPPLGIVVWVWTWMIFWLSGSKWSQFAILSLPLAYSAAIMKWQDASIAQQQIQHAQETSGTGAYGCIRAGCVMSCGIWICWRKVSSPTCPQHSSRCEELDFGLTLRCLHFFCFQICHAFKPANLIKVSGRHHARAPLPAKSTRDKWRTCRTPAKGLAQTCFHMDNIEIQRSRWSILWATDKMFCENKLSFSWFCFDSAKSQGSAWDHRNWFRIGVPYDHSSALECKVSEIRKKMAIMAGHRERAGPKSSPERLP